MLEDLEVGHRGRQVEGRRGRHRAAHVVRCDQNVVRLGPRRELSRLGEPAHHREVRLDDVRGSPFEDLAELVPDVDPLAGRDRDVHFARDLHERADVVRRHRLLDPARAIWLELACDRDGLRGSETAVHLDKDLAVRTDALASRLDERDRAAKLGVRKLLPRCAEGIELHRTVALRHRRARSVADVVWHALDRVPAVRIGRDPVADGTAEKLVHGQAERFADDVPAGHVDHRERGHRDLPGARVVVADHATNE